MHKDFQRFNPVRSPSWRYDRVLELVEARPHPRRASRKRDDDYVRLYRSFLLKFIKLRGEEEQLQLFPDNPAMYYAHLVFYHPDTEWRALLEARLLTREDDEEIANRFSMLPEAVDWYEKLFYNVRDRLENRDWIVKTILGSPQQRSPNRENSITHYQRDMLYRLLAYFGGPVILDTIFSGFTEGTMPRTSEQVESWLDEKMRLLLKQKATLAARVLEVNRYNVMQLMELHLAFCNAARDAGATAGAAADYMPNISEALGAIPWTVGKQSGEKLPMLQQEHLASAIEPRAHEQLAVASGVSPPSLRLAHEQYQRQDEENQLVEEAVGT
jgi:hypothetical protein